MSLRLLLRCDGHRLGEPCLSAHSTSYGYSPTLRSDDTARVFITSGMWADWRIGATDRGGDLCPFWEHDEEMGEAL